MNDTKADRCLPCTGGVTPFTAEEASLRLEALPDWELDLTGREIAREFCFEDYHRTMAFVNAVAWVAHRENHHPHLEVSYRRCMVRFATHAAHGLTENDFLCAAKVDALAA